MADHIAIMGNEPYEEWIKRDDKAQRLFKAYCDKWPNSDIIASWEAGAGFQMETVKTGDVIR